MPTYRECRECGKTFDGHKRSALFCSEPCRSQFNRRRQVRGTELYDVIMSANFDPGRGAHMKIVQGLVQAYRNADLGLRAGRRSWQDWQQAQTRIPIAFGTEGDKR